MDVDTRRWMTALDELMDRVGQRLPRSESRERTREYFIGLLSDVERKNTWQLAEALGHATPYALQQYLNKSRWDSDDVRDVARDYVVEHLGDEEAILVVDETGFLKKGDKSVGVQRQYSGTAGRIENCQIGVFLTYAAATGTTFLDRELYLPASWTDDPDRCDEAGVPEGVGFATKPELALRMLDRAVVAGVPARWVTADAIYGEYSALRELLERHGRGYVLGVSRKGWVRIDGQARRVGSLLDRLPREGGWTRLSVGDGSKGQRVYDWRHEGLPCPAAAGWERWLLVRRSVSDPRELKPFVCFAPVGTSLATLARVAASRWTVEQCFEEAKGEVGLDEYEVRTWPAWYRHITLSCLAHAFLAVLRATAPEAAEAVKKGGLLTMRTGSLAQFKASRGLSSP